MHAGAGRNRPDGSNPEQGQICCRINKKGMIPNLPACPIRQAAATLAGSSAQKRKESIRTPPDPGHIRQPAGNTHPPIKTHDPHLAPVHTRGAAHTFRAEVNPRNRGLIITVLTAPDSIYCPGPLRCATAHAPALFPAADFLCPAPAARPLRNAQTRQSTRHATCAGTC